MNRLIPLTAAALLATSTMALADPAGRQSLEAVLRNHATEGPLRVLHALGERDATVDSGEIVLALARSAPPNAIRRMFSGATYLRAQAGSVTLLRRTSAEVPLSGGDMLVLSTRINYSISGYDLTDLSGLMIKRNGQIRSATTLRGAAGAAGRLSGSTLSASTPTGATATATPPPLRRGDRGDGVKALQAALRRRGHRISADGIFGAATENALRAFQSASNLPVTGSADARTVEELVRPGSLSRGSSGEDVRLLQQQLNIDRRARGLAAIKQDGKFGPGTEAALRDFQRSRSLPQSGQLDYATYSALQQARPRGTQGSPLLQRGDRSNSVKSLQYLLNRYRQAKGLPRLESDGNFGPNTEAALRAFQREKGLPAHGIADARSWTLLRQAPTPSTPTAPAPTNPTTPAPTQPTTPAPTNPTPQPVVLARGSRGDDVRVLQRRINRHREALGLSRIGEDGIFGAGTEAALRDFQRRKGLPVTGRTDMSTVTQLNDEPPAPRPTTPTAPTPTDGSLRGVKVALDSGHGVTGSGAFDPGAVNRSTGLTEYQLNLEVAQRVRQLLRARGATVSLNAYPRGSSRRSLYRKGQVAAGHHIFVSIHHNAYNRSAQGSVTLTHSRTTRSSTQLAQAIQRELVKKLWNGARRFDRGVRKQGLGVLRGAHSKVNTAVLVEGFFLDPAGVNRAQANTWVELEAQAIAQGIANYWRSR